MTFDEWWETREANIGMSAHESAKLAWDSAVEEAALAAWKRGVEDNEPGTMINRRVITGYIVSDIRALSNESDAPSVTGD